MFLACVDFSKNNLLTEQLNVRSFCELPILNTSLLKLQLTNFADFNITKAYIIDSTFSANFSLFKTENVSLIDFNKILFELDGNELVILFRNDVYFENDFSEYEQFSFVNDFLAFTDKNGICYCFIATVKTLRKLNNKNISVNDLFEKSWKYAEIQITPLGYIKVLNSVKNYKECLFEILNGVTLFKPPHVAEGVFTDNIIPEGNFSIVPPVYFGGRVQIESGSTVGPNAVIYNDTLISSDTSVSNSILFNNVYVSSNCFVDGTICCKNASIKRHTAIFSGSVIGENSLIGEDMHIENNSIVKSNVKYDKFIKSPFSKKQSNDFEYNFRGLSPDKAALLGSAIASVFKKPKIIIGSDGSPNSLSIKLALLSGLIASGAECFDMGIIFKTQIFFGSVFCECDYSVFVDGKPDGTNIEIYNSDNNSLSKADCNNIFDFCNKKNIVFVDEKNCKKVRQIRGLRKMYVREIASLFDDDISFNITVGCKNEIISNTLQDIISKILVNNNGFVEFLIDLDNTGTKLNVLYKNKVYADKTLQKIVYFYNKKNKNAVGLQNLYYQKLWRKDPVFLLFSIFYIIEKSGKTLPELVEELPDFFISSRSYSSDLREGDIARKISVFNNNFYKNGSYNIPFKGGFLKVIKNTGSNRIKVLCASDNMSFSEELCDFLGGYLTLSDA